MGFIFIILYQQDLGDRNEEARRSGHCSNFFTNAVWLYCSV
jgi:hypothetical protein